MIQVEGRQVHSAVMLVDDRRYRRDETKGRAVRTLKSGAVICATRYTWPPLWYGSTKNFLNFINTTPKI